MLRAFAGVLGLIAVGCLCAAIVGMVTGRPSDKTGWLLRALAVLCFAGAVALNSAAH